MWRLLKKFQRRPPTPAQRLEAQLLRQWRQGRLETFLAEIPLRLTLLYQSLCSAEIEEEKKERTAWFPVHRRLSRRLAKLMRSASALLVLSPLKWLSRRRCLQPARVRLIQFRRRCLVNLLLILVKCLRLLFRGARKL